MSHEDWLKDKGEIYLDYTFDEIKRKWNGRIIAYKGHVILYETEGHNDEECVKDALKLIFDEINEELSDGGEIENLSCLQR